MSRWQFEIPSAEEATAFLVWRAQKRMYQDDLYHDAIAATRRLIPKTTERERQEAHDFNEHLRWGGT